MQTCKQKYPQNLHTSTGVYTQTEECMIHTQESETHRKISITYSLSAFRARKWCEVCWAQMCCAVKMQFRCVAFPDSLRRFVFHWRNLDLVSAEVQFGFSITLIREGRGGTCTLFLHMESLILSPNYTPALRSHHSNAVGAKIVQQMIYSSASPSTLLSSQFHLKTKIKCYVLVFWEKLTVWYRLVIITTKRRFALEITFLDDKKHTLLEILKRKNYDLLHIASKYNEDQADQLKVLVHIVCKAPTCN